MIITTFFVLALIAFVITLANAIKAPQWAPLWVAVMILCIMELMRYQAVVIR